MKASTILICALLFLFTQVSSPRPSDLDPVEAMTTRRCTSSTHGDNLKKKRKEGSGSSIADASEQQQQQQQQQYKQSKAARISGWSSTTQTPTSVIRGASGAFPLPPELWDHVLSYFRLRELPLATLIDLMAVNACTRLRTLDLSGRRIGPCGARALADRIRARACPDLEEVG